MEQLNILDAQSIKCMIKDISYQVSKYLYEEYESYVSLDAPDVRSFYHQDRITAIIEKVIRKHNKEV